MHVGHKVLMGVDDSISLIAGDPQVILDQHLRHHLLKITILLNYIFSDYLHKNGPSCFKAEKGFLKLQFASDTTRAFIRGGGTIFHAQTPFL